MLSLLGGVELPVHVVIPVHLLDLHRLRFRFRQIRVQPLQARTCLDYLPDESGLWQQIWRHMRCHLQEKLPELVSTPEMFSLFG